MPQGLAAVRVDVSLEVGVGWAHDGLGHTELDVRSHQVQNGLEGARMVDQFEEYGAFGQDVPAIQA